MTRRTWSPKTMFILFISCLPSATTTNQQQHWLVQWWQLGYYKCGENKPFWNACMWIQQSKHCAGKNVLKRMNKMSNFRMTTRYIVSTQTNSIFFKFLNQNHESHGKIQSCIIVIMFVFFPWVANVLLCGCNVSLLWFCCISVGIKSDLRSGWFKCG